MVQAEISFPIGFEITNLMLVHEVRVLSVSTDWHWWSYKSVNAQKETWINPNIFSLVISAVLTETICSSSHLLLLPLEHLFSFTDFEFSVWLSVFSFLSPPLLLSFNHSLSSFPHTSRPSASFWLSFIRPEPHFLQSAYSGRPFSLQMPAFVESKRLFKINFHDYLLCFFFPILHSFMCILINSLCTSFTDKENRFSSSQKIGLRTYLYEQHSRQFDGALNNSLS